jgi:hypothetical protein
MYNAYHLTITDFGKFERLPLIIWCVKIRNTQKLLAHLIM